MRCHRQLEGQARAFRAGWAAGVRRAGVLLAAAALVAVGGACGSGSGSTERTEDATTTTTTASAPRWSPDEEAALDAYREYIRVVDDAFTDPVDSEVPELDDYAVPEAVEELRRRIAAYELLGRAKRPNTSFEPETITVNGSEATIVGCLSDFGVVYEVGTGAVLDDERVERIATTVLVRGEDERWRVSQSDDGRDGGPCEA